MTVRVIRTLPLMCLAVAGCVGLPARFCLTPAYDAPAGFSETYHAALSRREPILQPGDGPIPSATAGEFTIGPEWPMPSPLLETGPGEPPIDW